MSYLDSLFGKDKSLSSHCSHSPALSLPDWDWEANAKDFPNKVVRNGSGAGPFTALALWGNHDGQIRRNKGRPEPNRPFPLGIFS